MLSVMFDRNESKPRGRTPVFVNDESTATALQAVADGDEINMPSRHLLKQLAELGFVNLEVADRVPGKRGRAPTYYRLTAYGQEWLNEANKTISTRKLILRFQREQELRRIVEQRRQALLDAERELELFQAELNQDAT